MAPMANFLYHIYFLNIQVSRQFPDIVQKLLLRLAQYNATAVPVFYPDVDERCDPALHGGYWRPWM